MLLAVCIVLSIAVFVLALKLHILRRSLDEMGQDLEDRLQTDTNVLLSLSTRDAHARRLATRLNRELRKLREQRQRYLSGDRELREAITGLSHDLRTPLTAIRGYLDLLHREEKSPEVEHYLSLIENRTDVLTGLTEELFRSSVILSTSEDLRLEPADIRAALEESLAGLYGAFRQAHIEPDISLPESPVLCMVDRSALERVFGNILSNALKYSSGDLTVSLSSDGSCTFTNTAPGLDRIQVERLFDRFYTVDAARKSTGLGLSIARTLTEHMGGTLKACYEADLLTLRVRFPRAG